MTKSLFTDRWSFRRKSDASGVEVRLPHDAMLSEPRSADAATGNHGGFFPGGAYVYSKRWRVPGDAAEREYNLFFEGVYGDTCVLLDGREIARCNSGYREFTAPLTGLDPGTTATIEVQVDNTQVPNSRWYTGAGIYRPVWLMCAGAIRFARDGIRISTQSIGSAARVEVAVCVEGAARAGMSVATEFWYQGTRVAQQVEEIPATGTASVAVSIPEPTLWSAETPHLYDVVVTLFADGEAVDREQIRTGLRTVQVDARQGLRINGVPVLLRGACVHHDNGILGAATFAAAEHRRARLLKDAGFNAIRSAHNPLSRAFLDACDELGLYVMDELTDVWFQHKTPHDGAENFASAWEADAAALIAKDRNRPSVIMYSIGNEIAETSTDAGVRAAGELHRYFRAHDPHRPTTLAVNFLLNLMASRGSSPFERKQYTDQHTPGAKKQATSTVANMVTARLGRIMELASRLPAADKVTRDALAAVDVAGYNYAFARYPGDRKRYPSRVIVGSESMPGDLPRIWQRVTSTPGAIGDFMWTGWDYLGEAGIGTWSYGDEPGGINKPYPALMAGCGVFDITGQAGAPALLALAVWDPTSAPGIAVRPLDRAGKRVNRTPWRSTDGLPSWSWGTLRGRAEIEVYSPDDQVEVRINGRSLGRKKAGRRRGFVARFTAPYEPGEIVAIGYRGGIETGRSSLRSAGAVRLALRAETTTLRGPDDLACLWVELADESGVVDMNAADRVTVTVSGPATLAGLGSAAPGSEESFTDASHTTHYGRALAIIRGGELPGEIVVTASSQRHGSATLVLTGTNSGDSLLNSRKSQETAIPRGR